MSGGMMKPILPVFGPVFDSMISGVAGYSRHLRPIQCSPGPIGLGFSLRVTGQEIQRSQNVIAWSNRHTRAGRRELSV